MSLPGVLKVKKYRYHYIIGNEYDGWGVYDKSGRARLLDLPNLESAMLWLDEFYEDPFDYPRWKE